MKSEPSAEPVRALERLSALSDGACDRTQVQQALDDWRHDATLRAAWHDYALIGDVLRSEDLSSQPAHDQDFLLAFRQRMAQESVVLAPSPMRAAADLEPETVVRVSGGASLVWPAGIRRRSWAASGAVAAGFLMVAGAVLVWRGMPDAGNAGTTLAQGAAPAGSLAASSLSLTESDVGVLQRSPDLDRYLNAHRQFAQGPSSAAPGGLRQVVLTPVAP
jgi:sigma-E factor negative regulatory protein RseA